MRYLGGTLGGTWLTALAGDLGAGIFDGAGLVANFESLNPANTHWTKPYNVYSKVDSETERFLEFETWWGSPVLLNAGEMQWIADNLFVGNKLSTGEIRTSDGVRIDLRNIKSPIVCFCSWGDDITPPQQALDWILDLYDDVSEIVANGQTIIYSLHHSIGHLGIFVSGKVAAKEHREFVSCMEMIEATPPGLYEAVISDVGEDTANRELVDGKYLFRLEPRTLDDIRAFGVNSPEDDKRFATVARLSEINLGLYRTFAEPWIRASVTEPTAEAMRALHPNRLRFEIFSDRNPFMSAIKPMAEQVRANRKPVSADNPLLAMEKEASSRITAALESWGQMRDSMTEAFFLTTYGSPLLAGDGRARFAAAIETPHRIERDLVRETAAAELRLGLDQKFEQGGVEEAVLRALIYVRRPEGGFDERGYRMLKSIREIAQVERAPEPAAIPGDAERAAPARRPGRGTRDRGPAETAADGRIGNRRGARCAAPARRRRGRVECWRASVASRGSRNCSARSRRSRGKPMVDAPGDAVATRHERYEQLIAAAQKQAAIKVAVAHPCDESSMRGVGEAMRLRLIEPILVGPVERIRRAADAGRSRHRRRGAR